MPESLELQQSTMNLFADMNCFPNSELVDRKSGLLYPIASTDRTPPKSKIVYPSQYKLNILNKSFNVTKKSLLKIKGTASDYGGGSVAAVEISMNGGRTWHIATGKDSWTYVHRFTRPKTSSFTDTSDCSTHKGDSDPIVSSYRQKLVQKKLLYDEDHDYDFNSQLPLSILIISRAVDDSGWMERVNLAASICNIQSRNVKKMMDIDDNSVLMSVILSNTSS